MKTILGEDGFDAYLKALSAPPVRALRRNLKKNPDVPLDKVFSLTPLDFSKNAFLFSNEKIGTHPYHHAGIIYVQEPGAMLPALSVSVTPSMRVLDTCASPGGKSTQIAELLEDGFLVSNEIVPSRCRVLSGNIERMGFGNVTVTSTDTHTLAEIFPEFFDLVIADAPCSGEGMFRKDARAVEEWSEENVFASQRRQREILDNAAKCTASGGHLVYSTCTFSTEENEENVKYFLSSHPEFTLGEPLENVKKASVPAIGVPEARRVYPHLSIGEGQFFAVFKKEDGETRSDFSKPSALSLPDPASLRSATEFIEKNLVKTPCGRIMSFHKNLVLVPENLPVPEKITYSCGITLGCVEKGVFRPHHQLFSALGQLFKNKLSLSCEDEKLSKYLHGDTIETGLPDGWCAVLVDGVSVGGGKCVSGVLKNHYPKGLRNM